MKFSTLTTLYIAFVVTTCIVAIVTTIMSALTLDDTITNQSIKDASIVLNYVTLGFVALLAGMTGYYFVQHHHKVVSRNKMMEELIS